MNETVILTIKVTMENEYRCTADAEGSIEQAPFESSEAFFARARAMFEKLKEDARG